MSQEDATGNTSSLASLGVVDEYGDEEVPYCNDVCQPARSELPLMLGELVALIDGALPDGGTALSPLSANVAADAGNAWRLRNFVRDPHGVRP